MAARGGSRRAGEDAAAEGGVPRSAGPRTGEPSQAGGDAVAAVVVASLREEGTTIRRHVARSVAKMVAISPLRKLGGGLEVSGRGTALDLGSLGDVDRDRGRRRTGDLHKTQRNCKCSNGFEPKVN